MLRPALIAVCGAALGVSGCGRGDPLPSGTIEADEAQLGSRHGGRVIELKVREGAEVPAGAELVLLAAPELEARRALLAARLEELERGPRAAEIEAARQEWEALKAQLEFARSDAARAGALLERRVSAEAEAERLRSVAAALERSATAAGERYALLREGTRPERLEQARAELAEVDAHLAELRVVAPSACAVEALHVKAGDLLAPNRPAVTVLLAGDPWVRVYIPASWLGRVRVGDAVEVFADAYPGEVFRGEIEQVSRQAEFTPRNAQSAEDRVKQVYGVKVRLMDGAGRLRAGMTVETRFGRAAK